MAKAGRCFQTGLYAGTNKCKRERVSERSRVLPNVHPSLFGLTPCQPRAKLPVPSWPMSYWNCSTTSYQLSVVWQSVQFNRNRTCGQAELCPCACLALVTFIVKCNNCVWCFSVFSIQVSFTTEDLISSLKLDNHSFSPLKKDERYSYYLVCHLFKFSSYY